MHPSEEHSHDSSLRSATRRPPVLVQVVCSALAAGVGVVCGYLFVTAPEWAGSQTPVGTVAGVSVALAVVCVIGHLGVHAWWGPALVWAAFMVGVVPPLSMEDALWAVAAVMLGGLVAGYLAMINLIVLGARVVGRRWR